MKTKDMDTRKSTMPAEESEERIGWLRAAIAAFFRAQYERGATCDEVEARLDLIHQTASPRVNELAARGIIVRTERVRLTRHNRPACVYVHHSYTVEK